MDALYMDANKTYGVKAWRQLYKNAFVMGGKRPYSFCFVECCLQNLLNIALSKFWRQHSTKQKLYGLLPPITKTIKVRRTRHVGHCWRSRDELISDMLPWTPSYGRAKAGRPARTKIQQLCAKTGCSLEDLPGAMDDRDGWEIRAGSVT